jgi:4-hydroxybutyrate CoA-transferase
MRVKIHACSPSPAQEWFNDEFADFGFDLAVDIFAGGTARNALQARRSDWYPGLFSNQFNVYDRSKDELGPIDVFATNVTPPDDDGYVTFGGTPWQKGDFIRRARTSIVEVCPWLPRVPTTERLHISEITAFVPTEIDGLVPNERNGNVEAGPIAGFVNEIIADGDTVQIGAGRTATYLPDNGVFDGKRDLGWHSEITPTGVVNLMMEGVFNGSRKSYDRGIHVTATINGRTPEQLAWLNNNPPVETRAVREVNSIINVARHEHFCAINNAFEVDLTGQICSESLGTRIYNGTGGQTDFHIGAVIAPGGKAITVLSSTATGGAINRIRPIIDDGSYVTVPRTFADFVVTEFGIARLAGRSQRQRADNLIAIAHPDHRAELRKACQTIFYPSSVSRAVVE